MELIFSIFIHKIVSEFEWKVSLYQNSRINRWCLYNGRNNPPCRKSINGNGCWRSGVSDFI